MKAKFKSGDMLQHKLFGTIITVIEVEEDKLYTYYIDFTNEVHTTHDGKVLRSRAYTPGSLIESNYRIVIKCDEIWQNILNEPKDEV